MPDVRELDSDASERNDIKFEELDNPPSDSENLNFGEQEYISEEQSVEESGDQQSAGEEVDIEDAEDTGKQRSEAAKQVPPTSKNEKRAHNPKARDSIEISQHEHVVYVTEIIHFECIHKVHSNLLSEEENNQLYKDKVSEQKHRYEVQVTVKGTVNVRSGMICDIAHIRKYLENIARHLKTNSLEKCVPFFEQFPSTIENVAIYFFNKLKECLTHTHENLLHKVKVKRNGTEICEYFGDIQ